MEAGRVLHEKDGYHGMYVCSVVRLMRGYLVCYVTIYLLHSCKRCSRVYLLTYIYLLQNRAIARSSQLVRPGLTLSTM